MVPGYQPEPLVAVVGNGLCCDGVGGGVRFPLSLGLRMEELPRSESYEGFSVVVCAAAGILRLSRTQQVPCGDGRGDGDASRGMRGNRLCGEVGCCELRVEEWSL